MRRMAQRRLALAAVAGLAVAGFGLSCAAHPGPAPGDAQAQAAQICASVVGLEPGERASIECVASLSASALARGRGAAVAATPAAEVRTRPAVKSYFYVSPREALQRRRAACAALGYDPAGPALDGCAADLGAALFRAEHPST